MRINDARTLNDILMYKIMIKRNNIYTYENVIIKNLTLNKSSFNILKTFIIKFVKNYLKV